MPATEDTTIKILEPELKEKEKLTWTEYIIINYRWVFVILFLLPFSVIYDLYFYTRAKIIFAQNSAPLQHERKVRKIQDQVLSWNKDGKKSFMCTGRPGWQTISFRQPAYKKTFEKIHIDLVDILQVNTEEKFVRCEPMVTMGQLTKVLLPLGWTIPVVPELDDLTVGGLVMGTGIESSSHKYGLFQHICVSFQLVLSDGSLVTCSQTENKDLFYSVPWSYGTIGFLVATDIKIIPSAKYVKLRYEPFKTQSEFISKLEAESNNSQNDFVEGLMYDLTEGVLMTGTLVNQVEKKKLNSIGRWYKPWFFKHVETFLKKDESAEEYIPLRDYYHRHSRSIFWEIQEIIPFGNNPLFRYILGWMVPPKVSLLKLTQGETIKKLYEKNHFIQDMLVPISSLAESLNVFHDQVKIYPIWLCPFNLPNNPGMVTAKQDSEVMFIDIGVYGTPNVQHFEPVQTTRTVEAFVRKVNGFQMMYADSYMTEEEYRDMFNHELYDKVRKELGCGQAYPEVYHKVNRSVRI